MFCAAERGKTRNEVGMKVTVRHSLPGRLRIRYPRNLTAQKAALAKALIEEQEGVDEVDVNYTVHSFLVLYDEAIISKRGVLALFAALTPRYLDDEDLLSAVAAPDTGDSLTFSLLSLTAWHFAKRLLPAPIRIAINIYSFFPRIALGLKCLTHGNIFKSQVLDAAAIGAAVLSGDSNTASNINFLLNVGDQIEEFTKKKSYGDLADRLRSKNSTAILVEGKTEREVSVLSLKRGDTIAVRTGALIAADGEVSRGEALVNQASITGEPLAVEKRAGDTVFAGTVLQEGEIFVKVREAGSRTKIQNILRLIDESQNLKVSSQVRSERLADQLVKANFLLSALTFLFTRNRAKVLATLMVDYSCAMKLSAPIAVLSAMKEAADYGIIVKGGKFLEDASKADTVVFDKTGTLTKAEPHLERIIPLGGRSEADILSIAACLEEHFAHPVASAIVREAKVRSITHPEEHAKVEYVVAHGIASRLKGARILIGSAHFVFDDEKVPRPDCLESVQHEALERGESLLFLCTAPHSTARSRVLPLPGQNLAAHGAARGEVMGIFCVNDPIREDAFSLMQKLRFSGIKHCAMISGDDEGAARSAAEAAEVDYYLSRALPEDKVRYIKARQAEGHKVIMIGDGINDSPAIACADTGIAMGSGAQIALESADIVLSEEDGLQSLWRVRQLGQRLMRRIDENNAGIVVVNTALMALSLTGSISAGVAALLHNASTIVFSARAARPLLEG